MRINDFKLERYFAKHEFTAKYLLSSSDCDGYPMSYVLENAKEEDVKLWNDLKLGYTESEGNPLLREAIIKHYKTADINNVVVASPGELNYITMNALLEEGDHVVTVAPAYQSLYEILNSLKCKVSYWEPDKTTWEFDVSQLNELVTEKTKLIIINFPHNPTGSYVTRQQLDEIVRIAEKNNAYLFSDEMYHKLCVSDMPELPPVANLYNKGISLWGTSKTFGLAGLRTGWLVSEDKELLHNIVAFKDYLSICNSAPSEILSLMALNTMDKYLLPNINKIKHNISLFKDYVQTSNLFSGFVAPKAGSTSFVQLNIPNTSLQFSDQLVENTGIMTVPAEMFEYEGKYIRVGFGRENFAQVLSVLHEVEKNIK